MSTLTYQDTVGRHVEVPPHLAADAEVPVLGQPQRQGDLLLVPTTPDGDVEGEGWGPVGDGVQLVVGEATGNTHWLHAADPEVVCRRVDDGGQLVALVDVPDGSAAYVVHTDEHGSNGLGPGRWEVRRKRELADEIRQVAD